MQLMIPIPEHQQALHIPPGVLEWSEEEFFQFCQANRELQIERAASGDIGIRLPVGGYSGYREGEAFGQLARWSAVDRAGLAFGSRTGFVLPSGAMRSPDAAWVQLSRLKDLSAWQKERFLPLCPDFVIEVASPSDEISALTLKMQEYRQAGLRLGWLILPHSLEVESYSPTGVQLLTSPESLSGDPVLPGFSMELESIWNPPF